MSFKVTEFIHLGEHNLMMKVICPVTIWKKPNLEVLVGILTELCRDLIVLYAPYV